MIDDYPIGLVQTLLEAEVGNPRRLLVQLSLFPGLIVIGLKPDVRAEKMFRKSLQQNTGQKTIEVTFVCQDYFRFRQRNDHRERSLRQRRKSPNTKNRNGNEIQADDRSKISGSCGVNGLRSSPHGHRSEERRVGKECRSRWATYDR